MQINKKQSSNTSKKILIIVLAAAATAAVAYGVYLMYFAPKPATNTGPQDTINYEPPTDEQKAAGDRQKEETINKTDDNNDPPNGEDSISVSYTAVNQTDGQLLVRALIGAVSNDGTCSLTLTKGDAVVKKTAGMQSGPNSSTCKGFNISVSELSPGNWTILLQVKIGSEQGKISQTFTVQ